jgi:hypothetical protein
MEPVFRIDLPADTPPEQAQTLAAEIRTLAEVENTGTLAARGLDPVSIGVWVKLAVSVVGAVKTAVPVIEKVINQIRGKGVKGAKITFADGIVVSVDEISLKDLQALLNRGE